MINPLRRVTQQCVVEDLNMFVTSRSASERMENCEEMFPRKSCEISHKRQLLKQILKCKMFIVMFQQVILYNWRFTLYMSMNK